MPSIVSESIQNGIWEILYKSGNRWIIDDKDCYILQKIPAKKLKNAIASYVGQIADDEAVLFLYIDNRDFFSSGKEGFTITTKGIYWRSDINNEIGHILIKNINTITNEKAQIIFNTDKESVVNTGILINFEYSFICSDEPNRTFLSDIVTLLKSQDPDASRNTNASTTTGQAANSGICRSCGAPKTGGGPCEYCGSV